MIMIIYLPALCGFIAIIVMDRYRLKCWQVRRSLTGKNDLTINADKITDFLLNSENILHIFGKAKQYQNPFIHYASAGNWFYLFFLGAYCELSTFGILIIYTPHSCYFWAIEFQFQVVLLFSPRLVCIWHKYAPYTHTHTYYINTQIRAYFSYLTGVRNFNELSPTNNPCDPLLTSTYLHMISVFSKCCSTCSINCWL